MPRCHVPCTTRGRNARTGFSSYRDTDTIYHECPQFTTFCTASQESAFCTASQKSARPPVKTNRPVRILCPAPDDERSPTTLYSAPDDERSPSISCSAPDDERPQGAMIGKRVCIMAWLLTRRLHIKKPAEHPAGESITIFLYYICDIPG